jgi:mRNA-degrading endonuclease YafQ of YafQ-DinJ toxin-antitoxin module
LQKNDDAAGVLKIVYHNSFQKEVKKELKNKKKKKEMINKKQID